MISDTFKFNEVTSSTQNYIEEIKTKATEMESFITDRTNEKNGRLMALAKTKLEEAIMWAVKGLTR